MTDAGEMGVPSAIGFAVGYPGGGVFLLVGPGVGFPPATSGVPDVLTALRRSVVTVAAW